MSKYSHEEIKYVPFSIFVWAIGILLTLIIFTLGIVADVSKKVEESQSAQNQILVQLKEIQTDILWIRKEIDRD